MKELAFHRLLPVVLLLCVSFRSAAYADDLLSVYRLAIRNDPTFRAAEANYRAAQQQIPQARANLLPSLSATAGINKNDEEVITENTIFSRPAGEARFRSDEYRLTLTQPLYDRAAWVNLRQADAKVRRAAAEYQLARQDLILRVTEAYFGVLLAQNALALAQAEKQALERNLDTVLGRRKAGSANITEVNDARARYQVALAREIEAANRVEDSREALREITGNTPGVLDDLNEEALFAAPDPPDVARWIESALAHNLAVRAAQEAAEAAREDIEQQRAARYPRLNAVGTRSNHDADGSIPGPGVRSTSTVVGIQLNWPIFQGGLVGARTEEAAHRYDAALQELERRRRAVERATRTAYLGAAGGAARIEALRLAVNAADSALSAKIEGRAVGLYTNLDVLDATRDLYQARRDYAEARHAYLLNHLRLKSAAGTLSEEDLAAINGWLR